jgi:hypothetical protein
MRESGKSLFFKAKPIWMVMTEPFLIAAFKTTSNTKTDTGLVFCFTCGNKRPPVPLVPEPKLVDSQLKQTSVQNSLSFIGGLMFYIVRHFIL